MQRCQPGGRQRAATGDGSLQPRARHADRRAGDRGPHRDLRRGGVQDGILMSVARKPSGQSGQAIVLIAIMLTVLIGMTAIAIDGARAYALRRDLQAAVDSAAMGNVNNLVYTPAVAALGPGGCGGAGGTAITLSGSGTLNVNGDVVANGSITVATGALRVAGDVYSRCQSSVAGATTACYPSGASSPCAYPDIVGATRSGFRLADPNYPAPTVVGSSESRPGRDVNLSAGTYAVNPNLTTNVCYFLGGGVYAWQAGYANSAALVSNELKPPDEPSSSNNQNAAPRPCWNGDGVNCAGSFMLAAQGVGGGLAIQRGTWAIEITSVRTDSHNGLTYTRESAPSLRKTVHVSTGH